MGRVCLGGKLPRNAFASRVLSKSLWSVSVLFKLVFVDSDTSCKLIPESKHIDGANWVLGKSLESPCEQAIYPMVKLKA